MSRVTIWLRGVPVRHRWLLAGVFAAALLVLLPLRLLLAPLAEGHALSAAAVSGPLWRGRIEGLRAGPLPLGDVHAGLRVLPLLAGRREFWIERDTAAGEAPLSAIVASRADGFDLREATGRVAIDPLGELPVSALSLTGFEVAWRDGRCDHAAGSVALELTPLGGMLPALAVSGPARCVRGALLLPLKSASGLEKLLVTIDGGGGWSGDLTVSGLPPELTAPLLDHGFAARPGGIGLSARGAF